MASLKAGATRSWNMEMIKATSPKPQAASALKQTQLKDRIKI